MELKKQIRQKSDHLDQTLVLPGLPSWYTLDGSDKGFYCDLSDEPEYKCRYFNDTINNRRGTLEMVSISRLRSVDSFQSSDSWLEYLNYLHENWKEQLKLSNSEIKNMVYSDVINTTIDSLEKRFEVALWMQ